MLKNAYKIAKYQIGAGKQQISKSALDNFLNYYKNQYQSIGMGAFSDWARIIGHSVSKGVRLASDVGALLFPQNVPLKIASTVSRFTENLIQPPKSVEQMNKEAYEQNSKILYDKIIPQQHVYNYGLEIDPINQEKYLQQTRVKPVKKKYGGKKCKK